MPSYNMQEAVRNKKDMCFQSTSQVANRPEAIFIENFEYEMSLYDPNQLFYTQSLDTLVIDWLESIALPEGQSMACCSLDTTDDINDEPYTVPRKHISFVEPYMNEWFIQSSPPCSACSEIASESCSWSGSTCGSDCSSDLDEMPYQFSNLPTGNSYFQKDCGGRPSSGSTITATVRKDSRCTTPTNHHIECVERQDVQEDAGECCTVDVETTEQEDLESREESRRSADFDVLEQIDELLQEMVEPYTASSRDSGSRLSMLHPAALQDRSFEEAFQIQQAHVTALNNLIITQSNSPLYPFFI